MSDFRDHRPWCPSGRPPTGRRLDMFPDHGAFPVWMWGLHRVIAREVHMNMGPRALGITDDLAAGLREWADWQDIHQDGVGRGADRPAPPTVEEDWKRWRADGRKLADRLTEETGSVVVYDWPDKAEDCASCGPPES